MTHTDFHFEQFTEFTIRPAIWDDLSDFCEFILLVWGPRYHWEPKNLLMWMKFNNANVYLMWHGKRLVGSVAIEWGYGEEDTPCNRLWFVAIHPEYRGKGLGKYMLQTVIGEHGGVWMLDTDETNVIARGLYEKIGFVSYDRLGLKPAYPQPGKVYYRLQRQ